MSASDDIRDYYDPYEEEECSESGISFYDTTWRSKEGRIFTFEEMDSSYLINLHRFLTDRSIVVPAALWEEMKRRGYNYRGIKEEELCFSKKKQ